MSSGGGTGTCWYHNETQAGSRWLLIAIEVDQFRLMGADASKVYKIRTTGSGVTCVDLEGARGAFATSCAPHENICRGLLEVSDRQTKWQLALEGTGTTLPAIKAFFRSFRPSSFA